MGYGGLQDSSIAEGVWRLAQLVAKQSGTRSA
jgi:hypothetical protein